MAYIRCPVRPYIPNPLRCFQCQRYGHSKTSVGASLPALVAGTGHDSVDCAKKEQCLNCKETSTVKIDEDTLTGDCSEDDEDLMDIQSGPSTSSSRGGAECGTFMTSFISWNCRGLRTRLDDLKSIISTYQPACCSSGDISENYPLTMQVRGYNCITTRMWMAIHLQTEVYAFLRPIYIPK
ncbi:hypothetical protein TNCV_2286141 [Trichonephila clavipes]|nr:hypothetical protein TNCV_2286141 [Trichonephila clavipes]